MATRTIVRMFDDHAQARQALHDLEAAGFTHDEVSIMAGDRRGDGTTATTDTTSDDTKADSGAGIGATLGTLVGGGAGLLAGLGSLAIPGIGPIVAAGWLVAALTGAGAGAAAGGLLGALTGSGVEERDAHVYEESVRRGGSLLTVRADETRLAQAETILAGHAHGDLRTREAEYRTDGWTGPAVSSTTSGAGTHVASSGPARVVDLDQPANTNIGGSHPLSDRRSV